MKKLLLSLVMCGLLGVSFAQAKEDGGKDRGKGIMGRHAKVLEQLDLNPEQRKKLDASKEAQMKEVQGLLQNMMKTSEELNDELMKPKLDQKRVDDLNKELKNIQGQMADKRVSMIMEIRKTLTPEQFAKFLKLTEEMRQTRMEKRMGAKGGEK